MEVRKNPEAFNRLRSASDALKITAGDLGGPVLVRMGQTHRLQQAEVFRSEGSSGPSGRWEALSPTYAARKAAAFGRRKILELTGAMKAKFTRASSPDYVQEFIPNGEAGGMFLFGAYSDIAAAHRAGYPAFAPRQSSQAASVFGGPAPRLPVRDMISKTEGQLAELRDRLALWYREERIPQVVKALGALGGGK